MCHLPHSGGGIDSLTNQVLREHAYAWYVGGRQESDAAHHISKLWLTLNPTVHGGSLDKKMDLSSLFHGVCLHCLSACIFPQPIVSFIELFVARNVS